jgi:1-acyl-sn-glycerol-3-phosphate acyltransferase
MITTTSTATDLAADISDATDTATDAEGADLPPALRTAMRLIRQAGVEFVRHYHRLDISAEHPMPDEPALLVANHGFGGIFDLNVLALFATLDEPRITRPVTILTHQIAGTVRLGPLIEALGARPAGRDTALTDLAAGHHVLLLPGGDIDAFKAWPYRNRILFAGRTGFAEIALQAGVPIVPIVTAGDGESLLVISEGQRLARATRPDKLLRLKALPVSVSLPWGLNIGAVGLLPYFPLPTKMTTAVLPAIRPDPEETSAELAARVERAMQQSLTEMTQDRRFPLGTPAQLTGSRPKRPRFRRAGAGLDVEGDLIKRSPTR